MDDYEGGEGTPAGDACGEASGGEGCGGLGEPAWEEQEGERAECARQGAGEEVGAHFHSAMEQLR